MPSWLDGLRLFLPMDEGSGDPKDFSSYDNHGTNYGASWVDGKYGKALSFNGTSDYVKVTRHSSLEPAQALTVTLWFKTSDKTRYVLLKGSGSGPLSYGLDQHGPVGHFRWMVTTTSFKAMTMGASWDDGVFHHFGGTYDGSFMRAYIDGSAVGTPLAVTGDIDYGSNLPLSIGSIFDYVTLGFNGVIDEIRIYNRVLSQTEIQESMGDVAGGLLDTYWRKTK